MIESVKIATNRYAPDGVSAINLYNSDLAEGLTLAQLVQQICIRSAAAHEAQSVLKMNTMTANSMLLEQSASWLAQIATGAAVWTAAKNFLVNDMGIPASELPDGLDTYDKRMQASKTLQEKMTTLAQDQQEDMIDLQAMVNRRDVAYSTASNIVHALGNSMNGNANNMI